MEKLPWMQFNTGDWLKDPKLSMCLPATRGIWIDAIAAMHENSRSGSLSDTPDQLVRVLRCTESALMAAVDDLQATGAGDVTVRNGVITLINRRMLREAKEREASRLRQGRYRSNGKITALSQECHNPSGSDSLSESFSDRKRGCGGKGELDTRFERFWAAYPRREARRNAWKAFQKLNPDEELMSVMIAWIGRACESDQWQDKTKIPHPATCLNQRRWEGDPPPKSQPNGGGEQNDRAGNHQQAARIGSGNSESTKRPFGGPAYIVGSGRE